MAGGGGGGAVALSTKLTKSSSALPTFLNPNAFALAIFEQFHKLSFKKIERREGDERISLTTEVAQPIKSCLE